MTIYIYIYIYTHANPFGMNFECVLSNRWTNAAEQLNKKIKGHTWGHIQNVREKKYDFPILRVPGLATPSFGAWRLTLAFRRKKGSWQNRLDQQEFMSSWAHRRTSKNFQPQNLPKKKNKMLHFRLCLLFVWSSHTWYLWVRNSVQKLEREPIMINSSYKIEISTFTHKDFITKLSPGQKKHSVYDNTPPFSRFELYVEIPVSNLWRLQIQGQDFHKTMAATARHVGMAVFPVMTNKSWFPPGLTWKFDIFFRSNIYVPVVEFLHGC